jgi:plastocyanin
MHDIAFLPQVLTVTSGTTITWTNEDGMMHTVTSGTTSDDAVWTSSPGIPPGGTFSVSLRNPGSYHYYCKPHMYSPAMHATIVVTQ